MSYLLRHPWIRHLRLHFNLLLTPIYLWGVLLADGSLNSYNFWLAYVSLQIFLYGGATAFNSYYDKDEGPIGGVLHPPPVDQGLLYFSIIFQLVGLLLALLVNLHFALVWVLLSVVFTIYSHPLTRLKANPLSALTAIGIGQGGMGFMLGWLAIQPSFISLNSSEAFVGIAITVLIVLGLYIVTQSYQTAEDRARGDQTLPVLLGARSALLLATLLLALGGLLMLMQVGVRFGWGWALVLGLFFASIGLWLLLWARSFDESAVQHNFYVAMRLAAFSSAALSAFLLWQLR